MLRAATAALSLSVLAACSSLKPFPAHSPSCDAHGDLDALWHCIGYPDPAPKEGGLASTLRMANGDLTRRLILNQTPSLACNTKPRAGFEHRSLPVRNLEAFVHAGDPGMPVIFVIHGLYDSNSNRYVRYVASALADRGFGVVAPDMRWHGCVMAYPSTLGIEESKDLLAWAAAVRNGSVAPSLGNRPIGMIGFSLGALDVIDTMSAIEAATLFDAGAISVSPPADLNKVLDGLDRMRTLIGYYFRGTLRIRNRRLGIGFWARKPFRLYLEWLVTQHDPALGPVDRLLKTAEPSTRLATVRRPLLILAARNDPVLGEAAVDAVVNAQAPRNVRVIATDEGGHIGIIGRDPRWFVDAMTTFFTNAPHIALQP